MFETLISYSDLASHLDHPDWAILDCRFSLADTEKGRRDYLVAHIPGAIYAHLDEDLSATRVAGITGRHPLPSAQDAARTFASWGIGAGVQVVCYDEAGGSLAASRAWWMLRWLGHEASAVLDGGWQKWLAGGGAVLAGLESRTPRRFLAQPRPEKVVLTTEVESDLLNHAGRLYDVRAVERYRGQSEPIDPIAGHIPGAISAPYFENLQADGSFNTKDKLRAYYLSLLSGLSPEQAVFYCGSGVTSTHSILALLHAGLGEARLYAGSWSEWICEPRRPIAIGD